MFISVLQKKKCLLLKIIVHCESFRENILVGVIRPLYAKVLYLQQFCLKSYNAIVSQELQ